MKRLIINAVLVAITLTAAAQTSRRQGSQTRETNRSSINKRTTEVKSNTSQKSEKNTSNKRTFDSKSQQVRSTNTQPVRRKTTTQPVKRETTTQPERHNTTSHTSNRTYDHSRTKPVNRDGSTTVTHKTNRVYHTDRTYTSPRKYVRTPSGHVHSRPSGHSHNHVYIKRSPARVNIVWDVHMHRDYCNIYPFVRVWRIPAGTYITTTTAYDAYLYIGDVKRVYGFVREVYYEPHADEYHLYLGDYFPFQDFTVIVPGYIARQMSSRPERYFTHQYIWTTGYITEFDNKPEMIIKRNYQIGIY